MQQYNAAQRTPYLPTYNSVDRGMLNGFQRQSAEPDQSAPQPSFILPPVPKGIIEDI